MILKQLIISEKPNVVAMDSFLFQQIRAKIMQYRKMERLGSDPRKAIVV